MPRKPRNSDQAIGHSFDPANGLTPIHPRIHCAATTDGGGYDQYDELDQIDIKNLVDTLAQVAISVARRRSAKNQAAR
jgi:hypothetical protein